jgi:hypothetical protein
MLPAPVGCPSRERLEGPGASPTPPEAPEVTTAVAITLKLVADWKWTVEQVFNELTPSIKLAFKYLFGSVANNAIVTRSSGNVNGFFAAHHPHQYLRRPKTFFRAT